MNEQDIPLRRADESHNTETVYKPNQTVKTEGPIIQRRKLIISAVIVALCIILIIIGIVLFTGGDTKGENNDSNKANQPTKKTEIENPRNSSAKVKKLEKYAVSSDSDKCSDIGRDLIEQGGNAVDAAIGTMFCLGLTTMQSMGIGGGFIMNIYIHNERKAYTYDARESIPINSDFSILENTLNKSLLIGVPGELRGYWEVHKRFGQLSWTEIIEPTKSICDTGFYMTHEMAMAMKHVPEFINDSNLKDFLVNKETNEPYKETTVIRPENLCKTLKIISNNGEAFYNGSVAEMLIKDLEDLGSPITQEDLLKYEGKWSESVPSEFREHTIYSCPYPSSGQFVSYILNRCNITENINASSKDFQTLLYHRIIEATKFAYRSYPILGETFNKADFDNLLQEPVEKCRSYIDDNSAKNDGVRPDAATLDSTQTASSHVSVLLESGDAVSVTSSINSYFGSALTGKRTGVLFNNALKGIKAPLNYKHSASTHLIRPMSTLSPIIATNKDNVTLVIGATGGSKIITALSTAIMRILWLQQDIKPTVDEARFNLQLSPLAFQYENDMITKIVEGLKKKGHTMVGMYENSTAITLIYKNSTGIYGISDDRREGDVVGSE